MANDDNLDLEFNVNGDGERAIERIKGKLRDLGTTAEYASQKQVDGANDALAKYKLEADVLDEIAQKEARVARAAAQTRVAANRVTASNASTSATVATAGSTAQARADLAIQRVLTEEVKGTNLEREQENRNLLTAGRLLTENEKQQNLIQQRTIAAVREEQRARQQLASEEQRAATMALRAEQQRKQAVLERARTERSSALAAERNAAALASPNLGSERRNSLANERTISSQDVEQTNALRYALYDTAQTATLVGTAVAGIGVASVVAAAQGQQQFANLSATIGDTNYDLGALNQGLVDLTTQTPTNLAEVVGVAQLGAQMNIAESDLDDFTKTVTQFSATTNVTSEQAAESFGKISQLLKVPSSEFDKLSSSVYQVGVDSVATESQILKTSEEIAGSASAYGFTADAVVGLSGAFASLAIQPEQARGATTRIFNQIETAVQTGGPKLDNYARILGTTSEAAADLWKQDPSQFFNDLVQGLSKSEDRLKDIRSIGATGVYDTNVLQRLASNADFLTTSLDTAKSAYDDGTAAGAAYAKATDTVIARLKELGNSLVALGIAAGGGLLQLLSPVIDFIKVIVDAFAGLPAPVLLVLSALTLLVGGYILLKGATATAIAAIIGLRYVLSQLSVTGTAAGLSMTTLRTQIGLLAGTAGLTGTAQTRLTGTIVTGGIAARASAFGYAAMGTAMKLIPWVLAITLAAQLTEGLYNANKASIAAASGFGVVSTSAKGAKISGDEITESFKNAKSEIDKLNAGNATSNVASFFGDVFNVTDFTKQAKNEIAAIDDRLAAMVKSGNGDKAAAQVRALGLTGEEVQQYLSNYAAAADAATVKTLQLGDSGLDSAGQLDAYKQALDDTTNSVDQLFGSLNQASDFGGAIQQLFSGIYDAGNAFGYLSETGRTNLANLQDAITQTAVYGQSLGLDTSESVAMLFYTLQQQGVDTAGLLQLISSQPYVFSADLDISKVQTKLAQLGMNGGAAAGVTQNSTAFSNLSANMNKLAVSAPRAATGIKKTKKAASEAAKEVRTLNDYASDLNTVFSDARTYRFGVQDALDDVESKWQDIRDSIAENNEKLAEHKKDIADARDELARYRADLAGLQAQLSQQKYFLTIAVQYGDTLRGQQISADIADLNGQIADKQKDITQAQKDATAPFESTTKSVIEQRQSLGELYDSYEDIIVEYARSGATQDQLKAKVDELRGNFEKQAKQAGYSKTEIDKYSRAFDDMKVAIQGVPKNITVNANTNPAQRALQDFLDKAKKAKATVDVGGEGDAGAKGYDNGVQYGKGWVLGANAGRRLVTIKDNSVPGGKTYQYYSGNRPTGGKFFNKGGFIPGQTGFPIGGFVPGPTPSDRRIDNVLGVLAGSGGIVGLQGGEPIINNAARSKYGDAMFDQINSLRFQPQVVSPTIVMPSGGSGYTEWSPTDRGLIMELIRSVGISISSTALEKSVGAANTASSRRRAG